MQREVASFPAADEDYFHDMDGGAALTPDAVKGRNTWIVWTGGNDRFWDEISTKSVGTLDLLKTISSHPALKFSRDNRWQYLGLVNEPCFEKATGPRSGPFRSLARQAPRRLPAGPVRERAEISRASRSARAARTCRSAPTTATPRASSACGCSRTRPSTRRRPRSGTPSATMNDPSYYNIEGPGEAIPRRHVVRLLPCRPEPDSIRRRTRSTRSGKTSSSNVGAQYFWVDRIFIWEPDPSSFVYQLFHTSRPGALDTSLVSTRQHQQPADDERDLQSRPAARPGTALGQGDAGRRRPEQQAVQRLRHRRAPLDAHSSSRRRPSGRRACSRTAPTRSARWAR